MTHNVFWLFTNSTTAPDFLCRHLFMEEEKYNNDADLGRWSLVVARVRGVAIRGILGCNSS
jgi:hypothetical protein